MSKKSALYRIASGMRRNGLDLFAISDRFSTRHRYEDELSIAGNRSDYLYTLRSSNPATLAKWDCFQECGENRTGSLSDVLDSGHPCIFRSP